MLKRRKKILNLVLIAAETGISKQDFENMLVFEKELFEEIMRCMDSADKKMSASLNGNGIVEEKVLHELVAFLEEVEEFVGLEGEKMGPFEKGQVANIPKQIADILIADNKAEIVES